MHPSLQIHYGHLTAWFADRNFGYVREDSGVDRFVHREGFIAGPPPVGTRLRFRVVDSPYRRDSVMVVNAKVLPPIIAA